MGRVSVLLGLDLVVRANLKLHDQDANATSILNESTTYGYDRDMALGHVLHNQIQQYSSVEREMLASRPSAFGLYSEAR